MEKPLIGESTSLESRRSGQPALQVQLLSSPPGYIMYEMDWAKDHGEYPEMDNDTSAIFTFMFVLLVIVVIIVVLNL